MNSVILFTDPSRTIHGVITELSRSLSFPKILFLDVEIVLIIFALSKFVFQTGKFFIFPFFKEREYDGFTTIPLQR